jgi:hypothetical protein
MRDLTDLQQRYAEYRLRGYRPLLAARLAGYRDSGGSGIRVQAYRLERHERVRAGVAAMTEAICFEASKAMSRGRPVSMLALKLLSNWPGLTSRQRERVYRRMLAVALPVT